MKYLLKLMRFILPEKNYLALFRRLAKLPLDVWDPNFVIKVADTQEELEEAYRLLHNCYVDLRLMHKHASILRCNVYSFLPETTTLIAKYKGEVVGSVTLIKDSPVGLPSDQEYKSENDRYRAEGFSLVEVSALAVRKDFRARNHGASVLLMKYIINYVKDYMTCTMMVCTVHPRAEDFYKSLFDFKRNGRVIKYKFVEGALAVHLGMDMRQPHLNYLLALYGTTEIQRNWFLFIFNQDERFQYPYRNEGQIVYPVMTPELLEYFFIDKTRLIYELEETYLKTFIEIYLYRFGEERMAKVLEARPINFNKRQYRVPIKLRASFLANGQYYICWILDITSRGCFIAVPKEITLENHTEVEISFRLGVRSYQIPSRIAWFNSDVSLRHEHGYGVQFNRVDAEIEREINSWGSSRNEQKVYKR